jgi:NADPH:quinone reductase-like Zn-dependent oxidoreductase
VVAANVLHATLDLRQTLNHVQRLLAPGGWLVLLEGSGLQRFADLLVGLTEGWWRFADAELRPSYPLLNPKQWVEVLGQVGFAEVAVLGAEAGITHQAVILAQLGSLPAAARSEERAGERAGHWVILADQAGLGQRLAGQLRAHCQQATLVYPGESFAATKPDHFQINPAQPEDFQRLLNELRAEDQSPIQGVLHLWALDESGLGLDGPATAQVTASQVQGCASVLHLVQALVKNSIEPSGLWLVTRGAQPVPTVGDTYPPPAVTQATVWGLGRAIHQEHPELNCVCLDLDPACPADEVETLYQALINHDDEIQIAFRRQERFVPRLVHATAAEGAAQAAPPPLDGQPFRLDSSARGILDNLALQRLERRQPRADEVEIEVYATGLGFRDVLSALGMYPGEPGPLGSECAGKIVAVGESVRSLAVGDEVVAMAPGSFGSFVTIQADYVVRKPDHLSLVEAATIPSAFVTAYYALHRLGGISAGERVLIHAAAGGVGLAAVQLAQRADAEIFATAGSPEKRAFLKALGVQHVLDSRSLAFADEILALTGGEGVDLVLNSLSGDFIAKSVAVLADNGRFLEIGKRDIWSAEEVAALKPNAGYLVIDLMAEGLQKPQLIGAILHELMTLFAAGTLRPLPLRVFPMQQVIEAFRSMARAEHLGKIVVALKPENEAGQSFRIRENGTYLITGGLGGLGLAVARWLVDQGAQTLVLLGRNAPSKHAQTVVRELEQAGAQVVVAQADVGQAEEIGQLMARIQATLPPLRGVIHSAGVLNDGILLQQDWTRFAEVFRPKVEGGWNLHTLTRHLPLDFFVLFSSAVALLRSAGQANHIAANTFLDALAHHRRSQGLPALSINWGPWSEVGAAAQRTLKDQMMRWGVTSMTPQQGIAVFAQVMGQAHPALQARRPQIGIVSVDWAKFTSQWGGGEAPSFYRELARKLPAGNTGSTSWAPAGEPQTGGGQVGVMQRLAEAPPGERQSILLDFVRSQALRVLALEPTAPLDRRQKLQELGLDSLMAVELRNRLGSGLGFKQKLPATLVFDYPTVEALVRFLTQELSRTETGSADTRPETIMAPDSTLVEALAELEQLSDEEAEALLFSELRNSSKGKL